MTQPAAQAARTAAATDQRIAAALVLYDGICGLCDRAVQFLLRHDRRRALTFAPLQGETALSALGPRSTDAGALSTMMFIRDYGTPHATTFERSEAWIEVLRELGGAWSVVSGLRLIPRRVRDLVYDLVARNRYAWFGSYRECRIPSPEQRSRFLP